MSVSSGLPPKAALVVDFLGRAYVAVNPGYASPPRLYCRVLVLRVALVVITFVIFAFCVAGQIAPSIVIRDANGSKGYSVWLVWMDDQTGNLTADREADADTQAVAVLSAIMSFAAMILAILFAVLWVVLERQRRREEEVNWDVLSEYGHPIPDADLSAAVEFPFTNVCVENRGQVASVPCEKRELRRRRWDKNFTIATLVLLSFAGIFAVTTLGLIADDYADQVHEATSGSHQRIGAAIPLFAVATALALLGIILVSVPQLTQAYMCGSLRPQRCTLMVVDDADAGEIGAELRRLMAGGTPLLPSVINGVPVALPGPSMESVLSQRQQSSSTPQLQQREDREGHVALQSLASAQAPSGKENGWPGQQGYCTAAYFEAPPQLFKVHPNPLVYTESTTTVTLTVTSPTIAANDAPTTALVRHVGSSAVDVDVEVEVAASAVSSKENAKEIAEETAEEMQERSAESADPTRRCNGEMRGTSCADLSLAKAAKSEAETASQE